MATHIFIDGYNFLWASDRDRDRPEAIHSFEGARRSMVERLSRHPQLARHRVTVVFDAHKTDATDRSSDQMGPIEIVYTRGGETADEVLKRQATELGPAAIIISSDREVARHAEKKGCGVLGSHEFDRFLNENRLTQEADQDEDDEPDSSGPSHRLPKAKRQALARLRKR